MRNFILEIITVIFGGNNFYLIAVDEQSVMISRSALAPRLEVSPPQFTQMSPRKTINISLRLPTPRVCDLELATNLRDDFKITEGLD